MSRPLLAKEIQVENIKYGQVKKSPSGAKSVYISYNGEKFVIQFPQMHIPYAVNDASELGKDPSKKDSGPKNPNYSINVSFRGKDDNKAIQTLYDKLMEVEAKIKKDVFINRLAWLNDEYDGMEVVVSKLFSSNMIFDKDKETKKILNRYPPTFRAKIPTILDTDTEGNSVVVFKTDAYDMENNELDFAKIINRLKGGKGQLLVHLVGLWFAGGKYGCTWKVVSGRFQLQQSLKYSFVEDSDDDTKKNAVEDSDDDDEDDEVELPAVKPVAPVNTIVSDSEEEDEDDEEEEEDEPPPPPPPVKKTVKKTTAKK